jgi:hypothetical protein
MEPKKILKLSKKMEFDVISITDHNCLKGALEAKKYEKEFGIDVIIGEERLTNAGDIIGLNLNEEIKSDEWTDVLEEIKDQGAISVLPHPLRGHNNIEEISKNVDLIEIWNSHSKIDDNNRAFHLALRYNKPPTAGSDAHIYSEIGNVIMSYNDVLDYDKQFELKYSKAYQKTISYIIKDIKLGNLHKIPFHLLRALF